MQETRLKHSNAQKWVWNPVCDSSSCQTGSGIFILLRSFVTQLMKNWSQDCFQCRVQRLILLWGRVDLKWKEKNNYFVKNTHLNIFNRHFLCILTLVNIFIVWFRKLVSTSSGIGKRWAAQSRMHNKVSRWPCQDVWYYQITLHLSLT